MRRFMMLAGLALAASLVLAGVAAASATAASEILIRNGSFPQTVLGSSNHISKLVTKAGNTVECSTYSTKGTQYSNTDVLLLLLWKGCKETTTSTECNSPGESSGNVHDAVLTLPVLLLSKLPGLLFELDTSYNSKHIAEFECDFGLVKIVVNGTVLGHISKPAIGVWSNSMTLDIVVKTAGTEQLWKDTEEKPNELDHLESSRNGGAFESSTEEVIEAEVHYAAAGVEGMFEG
jgi:hypothetical protein